MKWSGAAPCQCHSSAGVWTRTKAPGRDGELERLQVQREAVHDEVVEPLEAGSVELGAVSAATSTQVRDVCLSMEFAC